MPAYLYVLWAVEDELVKIGVSRSLKKRVSAHSGNSSNPLEFKFWKLYQFQTIIEAKQIENIVGKRLSKLGFCYRNKKELFKCCPTEATHAIDGVCKETGIAALRNFPFDQSEVLNKFADFPCLPEYALDFLNSDLQAVYWHGVKDILNCLSFFDGIKIRCSDLSQVRTTVEQRLERKITSELSTIIVDHYRNLGSEGWHP
jgi:T5orf172 domain